MTFLANYREDKKQHVNLLIKGSFIAVCKRCGNERRITNGIVHGKQRYKCKDYRKTYRDGDVREKYLNEQRLSVLDGIWKKLASWALKALRSKPLIIKWICKFSKILRQKLTKQLSTKRQKYLNIGA